MLQGSLVNGGAASFHLSVIGFHGPGSRLEVYGTKGTLVLSSPTSFNIGAGMRLQGAEGEAPRQDLETPARLVRGKYTRYIIHSDA